MNDPYKCKRCHRGAAEDEHQCWYCSMRGDYKERVLEVVEEPEPTETAKDRGEVQTPGAVMSGGMNEPTLLRDPAEDDPSPLHVQVAQARGCAIHLEDVNTSYETFVCGCVKTSPFPHGSESHGCSISRIPRYDTDWAAAGPLVEEYDLNIWRTVFEDVYFATQPRGIARIFADDKPPRGEGATRLEAICRAVIAIEKEKKQ